MTPVEDADCWTGERMIHKAVTPQAFIDGKWTYKTEDRDVLLMAVSGKFAMVRRPRAMPYVAETKDLYWP